MPTHAFNKNMNKPRNPRSGATSNELMSIRAQLRELRKQTNPNLIAVPTSAQPKPVASAGEKWHSRTVSIIKTVTGLNATSFTLGDIVKGLTQTTTLGVTFRVKDVKVWNSTLGQGIKASFLPNVLTLATVADLASDATDYGSGTQIAGIRMDIPDTLTKILQLDSSNATSFLDASTPLAAAASVQIFVCHVQLDFLM
jgi:hypothetical protein